MAIKELLSITFNRDASDLHLLSGHLPTLRIQGNLQILPNFSPLTSEELEEMVFSLLTPAQKEVLVANKELDFSTSFSLPQGNVIRFRGNAYYEKGSLAASFRVIPEKIKTLEELNLPSTILEFAKLKQGFVLVTGGSGQGKSTTLACLINEINKNRRVHIVTIEDPIEYVFPKGKAIISQREMYQDTHSWKSALKSVLREDPDIVYIGEMRDFETISSALTIAETGHLVFSTLHTNSASQTIDRILDIFPPSARDQVRMQLSMVISGVVSQRLMPSLKGPRVPICEVLLGTPSIKNTIREGKIHLIDNLIQMGKEEGMMLFEDHLKELIDDGLITQETALDYALRPERFWQLVKG